jgi:hypothetical protein
MGWSWVEYRRRGGEVVGGGGSGEGEGVVGWSEGRGGDKTRTARSETATAFFEDLAVGIRL